MHNLSKDEVTFALSCMLDAVDALCPAWIANYDSSSYPIVKDELEHVVAKLDTLLSDALIVRLDSNALCEKIISKILDI